jgi:hypothetical protein
MDQTLSTYLAEVLRVLIELLKLVICTAAVSTMSVTLSKAGVFAPLRQIIKSRSKWLGKLLDCHYCTSHWMALAVVAVFQPRPIIVWLPVDLLLSAFAVVALSPIFAGLIFNLYDGLLQGDNAIPVESPADITSRPAPQSGYVRPRK